MASTVFLRTLAASLAIAGFLAAGVPASADESGMASIHAWRKVGKKTCLIDHTHNGSGNGPTLKAAELSTIKSWASFTDLEYGSSWADYRIAVDKSLRCARDSSGYSCTLDATPCRPW